MGSDVRSALARVLAVAVLVVGVAGCVDLEDSADGEPPSKGSAADTSTTTEVTSTTAATTSQAAEPPATVPPATEVPDGRDVVVTSITDGDTFRAGEERVRLIGIDTPEISGGVECFGREASDALEALIPVGSEVRLVADVEPVDRYDRSLAYVYRLSDGLHVNLRMAEDGYASPLTIPPNVAHSDDFVAAARTAREAGQGLWSACDEAPGEAPPSTAAPVTPGAGGPCDPAYPDVCIPPSPPDLDCADIPHRRFRVLPPDPHRFDGGGDGIGCERD